MEYSPDILPALVDLYDRYASVGVGLTSLPREHWESLFIKSEIDPRRDVIIASCATADSGESPRGFCWLYTKPAPSHVYMRGPYVPPEDPDLTNLLDQLVEKSIARAGECNAGHLEGRSLHPSWAEAYARSGFRRMGAYERWREFPLKGAALLYDPPGRGTIRDWRGVEDLPVLMDLFNLAFADHWDYLHPEREDWEQVIGGRQFRSRLLQIAYTEDEPAGYVFGQLMQDYASAIVESCYLVSIGVHPRLRGRGWGKALLSRWLRACYDSGLRAVELDVDEKNDVARSMYGRFGFRRLRTEEVWRKYLRE